MHLELLEPPGAEDFTDGHQVQNKVNLIKWPVRCINESSRLRRRSNYYSIKAKSIVYPIRGFESIWHAQL